MVGTDSVLSATSRQPRTYGSFPRILGQFVREERLLGLEEAVRKMTGTPAARLGLPRPRPAARRPRRRPRRLRSRDGPHHATYDEPRQFPIGIPYVIVNGTLVVDDGVHTGATPGPRAPPRAVSPPDPEVGSWPA